MQPVEEFIRQIENEFPPQTNAIKMQNKQALIDEFCPPDDRDSTALRHLLTDRIRILDIIQLGVILNAELMTRQPPGRPRRIQLDVQFIEGSYERVDERREKRFRVSLPYAANSC